MSTKFSTPSPKLKPPGICKKPPPPFDVIPPGYTTNDLLGLCSIFMPGGSPSIEWTTPLNMIPAAVGPFHEGVATVDPWEVVLEMVHDPATNILTFNLELYQYGILQAGWQKTNVTPQNLIPFDSGYQTLENNPPLSIIACRVWW